MSKTNLRYFAGKTKWYNNTKTLYDLCIYLLSVIHKSNTYAASSGELNPKRLKFTSVTIILAIIFRIDLSTSITNKMTASIIIYTVAYAILMWFNGRYFGRKEYLPIYDIGFRFHLSTFSAHNVVSVLWFLIGFESRSENINVIYITALIWPVFLIIHLIYYLSVRKSSIMNLDKEDFFE